jgi:serine phosphatase RsbU (regulator of sigma subunit)
MEVASAIRRLEMAEVADRGRLLVGQLAAARRIMDDLFPQTLSVDPRLEVGAINVRSLEVGGDYYDIALHGQDTAFFVLADAMGNGIPASVLMASFQGRFRLTRQLSFGLEATHTHLAQLVESNSNAGAHLTGVLGAVTLRMGGPT